MKTPLENKILLSLYTGNSGYMYASDEQVTQDLANHGTVKVVIGQDTGFTKEITTVVTGSNYIISEVYRVRGTDIFIIREIDIELIGLRQPYETTNSPMKNIQDKILATELKASLGNCEIHQILNINTNEELIDYLDGCNFIIQVGSDGESYHIIGIEEREGMKIFLAKDQQYKEVGVEILNLLAN